MKIGLWSDCHNFPSLPLMKLSAYHKSLGDSVEHYVPLECYDLVYASKVFTGDTARNRDRYALFPLAGGYFSFHQISLCRSQR